MTAKKTSKIMVQNDFVDFRNESWKKESLILNETKSNICIKCGDGCIFNEFLHDNTFILDIMPTNNDFNSIIKCKEIKEILME